MPFLVRTFQMAKNGIPGAQLQRSMAPTTRSGMYFGRVRLSPSYTRNNIQTTGTILFSPPQDDCDGGDAVIPNLGRMVKYWSNGGFLLVALAN